MTSDFLAGLGLSEAERGRIQDQGDSLRVTLLAPITYRHSKLEGERTLTELSLVKTLKGKHLKAMDQAGSGGIAQSLALVGALAGVPAQAMDELDARDMEVVLAVVEPFLPKSRRTGMS